MLYFSCNEISVYLQFIISHFNREVNAIPEIFLVLYACTTKKCLFCANQRQGVTTVFWENYRSLCEKAKKSPNGVAGEIGVSSGTVTGWKNGAIPRKPVIEKLASYFGVSTGYLLGENTAPSYPEDYDNLFPVTRRRYPLLGDIACGEPIFAEEDRESYIESGTDIQADFCLRAKGDSMIGARILDGDIVFIQKMPMVDNGSIAAVIIDNEATLKRVYYYPEDRKLVLAAENAKYAPFVYVGEELDHICILGKAIAFQSDVQ